MTVAITNRMQTMVMGGTPEFRIVFELTKDRPQNSTVPQRAAWGRVLPWEGRVERGRGFSMRDHGTRTPEAVPAGAVPAGGCSGGALLRQGAIPLRRYSSFSFLSFGEITIRQYPAAWWVL